MKKDGFIQKGDQYIPNMYKLAEYLSEKYSINLQFAYGYQPYMYLLSVFNSKPKSTEVLRTIVNDISEYNITVTQTKDGLLLKTEDCINLYLIFKLKGGL